MPLHILYGDITKISCDAIVNAANSSLLGGGGVDGAIHRAAGPGLLAECRTLNGCRTGEAKITKGYRLPCRYVIHTVGPVWEGGENQEEELLRSCYRNSLQLAKEHGCSSVAFPLISAGVYGYPKGEAYAIAVETIGAFMLENEMDVTLMLYDPYMHLEGENRFRELRTYVYNRLIPPAADKAAGYPVMGNYAASMPAASAEKASKKLFRRKSVRKTEEEVCADAAFSLEDAVKQLDESFSQMLLRKIDEKGLTDAQVYKKANVDRKLFSKIRSDVNYRTSKPTALAFAVALELNLSETRELLMKAGFALSHSNKFDIILEYFIERGNYDVFAINEALFAFDQPLLGG